MENIGFKWIKKRKDDPIEDKKSEDQNQMGLGEIRSRKDMSV